MVIEAIEASGQKMRIDAAKLGSVREAMDAKLVEVALEHGLSRLGAAAALADRMGFVIRLIPQGGVWIAYAIPLHVYRRALGLATQGAAISATGTELLEREPWHYESDSRDDAIVATLCRLFDENLDVAAGDGVRLTTLLPGAQGARYASMNRWFETVKQQWLKLATPAANTWVNA